MAPARKVGLADTSLRSLPHLTPPARASIGSLLTALGALDKAGLHSIDAWGDMTFDHSLRVLGESPWERLRVLADNVTATPLRLHLRGRCLLGFRPYSWSVVEGFVKQAVDCGVRSFLVLEPLDDLEALARTAATVRGAGASLALTLVHAGAPRDVSASAALARRLAQMGPDSVCVKTAGLLGPKAAGELVAAVRESVTSILEIDLDNGSGLGASAAVAAVEAGADVVHCSAAPLGLDPSGVPLVQLLPALLDAGLEPEADVDALAALGQSLADVLAPYCFVPAVDGAIARAMADYRSLADMPGDLFRQLGQRLDEHGALARFPEVLEETMRVRAEVGSPALGPPIGQVVATQAVLNILYAARWQVVPDEMKALLRGEYGALSPSAAPEMARAVLGEESEEDLEVAAPAPSLDDYLEALGVPGATEGDALLQALAPDAAAAFLRKRLTALQVDLSRLASTDDVPDPGWEDEWHDLGPERVRELVSLLEASAVDELTIENKGTRVTVRKSATGSELSPSQDNAPGAPRSPGQYTPQTFLPGGADADEATEGRSLIRASMVGTFYRSSAPGTDPFVDIGRHVEKGDVLCVLEAMKLMNEMVAETSGTVAAILVEDGTAVEYGQPLFLLDNDL
jgi:oxaloacetate decarboxylase alpha subunit